jgi:L-threonylcarbamoyladenylate synthase
LIDPRVEAAARLIRAGELVAFPTETVYGLGANAWDAAAVDRIYQAKGRPPTIPLIVHVHSIAMARELVLEWPERANLLAERFWPGPLTLVLPKAERVPDRVTAGLDTVGIRMPDHAVALDLIREAGVPIAAPSANRFSELSPTTAAHVREALGSGVAMVLDGGPTRVGIESTVLSLAGVEAVLLRPGMISQAQIEEVIGSIHVFAAASPDGAHASPGMHRKHYSPRTPLVIVTDGVLPAGRVAYLWLRTCARAAGGCQMPAEPHAYAARLYQVLHELDSRDFDCIAVERPPSEIMWAGITDRLERASES